MGPKEGYLKVMYSEFQRLPLVLVAGAIFSFNPEVFARPGVKRGIESIELSSPDVLRDDWMFQYRCADRIKVSEYRFPAEQVLNRQALKWSSDKSPVDTGIRRLEALISSLKSMGNAPDLTREEKMLEELKSKPATSALYIELRKLTRRVILSNPLLDFGSILFISRGTLTDDRKSKVEYDGDHFCDQYFGHNAKKGGGLFILKNWKSEKPELIDVVKGLKVPWGTHKGMPLSEGAFLSPDLSWDGKTVLFAWSCGGTKKWDRQNRFSIFRVNVDGTGLVRLTDTQFDDFDPAWLPGGRVIFISSQRGGYGRCHGRRVPTYTLYSMEADGSDRIPLSYHETNEFHPSVDNNGMVVYTRWDYVDRDANIAHHMWHCAPDGRDPRSYHGNYPLPLNTFEKIGKRRYPEGLNWRPGAEFNCRAIPESSSKYIATAGPHHGQAFGSLILIDIRGEDDRKMSQVKRIMPDAPLAESEWRYFRTDIRTRNEVPYGTAWPLSESYYLCNCNRNLCIADEFGNREIICLTLNGLRPKNKCISCHQNIKRENPKTRAPVNANYGALRPYVFFIGNGYLVHRHGGSRTTPGHFGALESAMGKALLNPYHRKLVKVGKLTEEDLRTVTLWLDLNSLQFTAYRDTHRQKRGEIVWPVYDVDPKNYTGVENR